MLSRNSISDSNTEKEIEALKRELGNIVDYILDNPNCNTYGKNLMRGSDGMDYYYLDLQINHIRNNDGNPLYSISFDIKGQTTHIKEFHSYNADATKYITEHEMQLIHDTFLDAMDYFKNIPGMTISVIHAFRAFKLSSVDKDIDDNILYSVDAWKTDDEDEEGVSLAYITINNDGTFSVDINDVFKGDEPIFNKVHAQLELLLTHKLLGNPIEVTRTDDTDLQEWLLDNTGPLIVEHVDVMSWGLWVEDCPYRIDLSEFRLFV